jgi:DNA-binding Lrp family transcriptional regulator
MNVPFDITSHRLLDEFQRGFPLVAQPFRVIGRAMDLSEAEVLDRLAAMRASGKIARVGATVRPNTAGASTLAALVVPEARIDEVAALVNEEEGVNHSYLREGDWNLWFVVTAPDKAALNASLDRIRARTGLELLDLRLVRPFNIDLGFRLNGPRVVPHAGRKPEVSALNEEDRPILQALTTGLALVPRPFLALAKEIGRGEDEVIDRVRTLDEAGILTRIGVIVRHRAVGWKANAMVVWDVAEEEIESAGRALASLPGVTLCYQRRTVPGVWRYGLFSMIHARSRDEALEVLDEARSLRELGGVDHRVLFSQRCFKQSGALLQSQS